MGESRSRTRREKKSSRESNGGLTGDGNSTESKLGLDVEDTEEEEGRDV